MRRALVGLGVVAALTAGGLAAGPGTAAAAPSGPAQHVIVLLRDQHAQTPAAPATAGQRASALSTDQAPVRSKINRLGGNTTHAYRALNAVAATVPASAVSSLKADPAVATVVPDLTWTRPAAPKRSTALSPAQAADPATVCPTDPAKPLLAPEALSLTRTNAQDGRPTARSLGYTGAGVKVGFIADGVDIDQPDFIRADGSHVFTDYRDFSGDGTAAPTSGAEALGDASSIAAQGRISYDLSTYVSEAHPLPTGCTIKIEGMAPGASLVGLKVFSNALLTAPTSTIIQAIDWAVSVDHVDVLNESFGSNPYPDNATDPISLLNRDAVDAGVTVVASTGDAGTGNTMGTASTDPWVIAAAGSTSFQLYAQETDYGFQLGNGRYVSDQLSSLSSGGIAQTNRVPDLMAPGDLGWALCSDKLLADGTPQYQGCSDDNGNPTNLQSFGGTSQSSPFTAGAAALVIQAYRRAHRGASPSPDQVRRVLDSSADDLGLPAQDQGAGRLNTYRAVQLAASLGAPANVGQGLLLSQPYLSTTAASGDTVTQQVTVRNAGVGPQRVTANLRRVDTRTGEQDKTVSLSAASPTNTFVDGFGITRSYVTTTFTVRVGVDRLDASVAWPGPAGPIVRLSLLDQQGTFTAYSLPQGTGNFGSVRLHQPAPGTWTAIIWTAASAAGYTGPVTLRTTDYAASSAGSVSPDSFTLAQGESRTLTIRTKAPVAQAVASSLVLTGRFGQTTTLPVVVRAVQRVTARAAVTFSGTLGQANGRDFSPGQADTYLFAVPPGARDLDVTIAVTGTPANPIVAHLSDPSGEPINTTGNQRASGDETISDPGVQIQHANPKAGVWQLTLELENPVSGARLPQTYRGTVALDQAKVVARNVPTSPRTVVSKAAGLRQTITVTNTGPAPQTYFVDARTADTVTYRLVATQAASANDPYTATIALPLPSEDVPAWLVPTEATRLTVGASATAPTEFDLMPLDSPTALNAPNNPDIEAVRSGNSATAVHTAAPIASALWAAFPSLVGPFPAGGAAPGSVSMQAVIRARGFATDVTSDTGNPLLATVRADAPASTPITLAPGGRATITVTLKPTAKVGTTVRGTLYLDTLQPDTGAAGVSSFADEVAAFPYAYTVGR